MPTKGTMADSQGKFDLLWEPDGQDRDTVEKCEQMLSCCLSMRSKEMKESRTWKKLSRLTKKTKTNGWKRLAHLPLAWKKA